MMTRKLVIPTALFTFSILCILTTEGDAAQIITRDESDWTCYDYAIAYHQEHPESYIITEGYTRTLRGQTHIICGEFTNDGKGLKIYDGMRSAGKMIGDGNYTYPDWRNSGKFYHFWVEGETPARNYKNGVRDNSHLFLPEQFVNKTVIKSA